MDKSLKLNKIKEYLKLKTDTEFAEFLGIGTATLGNWRARNTFNEVLLLQKCDFLSSRWLMLDKGDMLIENNEGKDRLISEVTIEVPINQNNPINQPNIAEMERYIKNLEEQVTYLRSRIEYYNDRLSEKDRLIESLNRSVKTKKSRAS